MIRVIIDGMSDQSWMFETWAETDQFVKKLKELAPWIKEIKIQKFGIEVAA